MSEQQNDGGHLFRYIVDQLNSGVVIATEQQVYFANSSALHMLDLIDVDVTSLRGDEILRADVLAEEKPFQRLFAGVDTSLSFPYEVEGVEFLVTFRRIPKAPKKALILIDFFGGMALDKPTHLAGAVDIPIDSLISTLEGNLRDLAWAKNIPLSFYKDTQESSIYGRRDDVVFMFTNKIGKLIKFSDRGEVKVRIADSDTGAAVLVEISNGGCALRDEDFAAMVEQFEKESDKAKNLIELHGGRLWVSRDPGLTFYFTIPKDLR